MGFFDDSIGGTIIGISPMNYVIASIILHFFKKNVLSSSFFTLWLIIGLVIIITTMNTAFIYHVAWQHSMLYQPLWYEGLVTIIAYPIFHLLLRTIFEKQHAR